MAIAAPGRNGEARHAGGIEASAEAARRLLTRLTARRGKLHVRHEAGPTGCGLHRQVIGLGHGRTAVAPSLIPREAGDRVKANRRDAVRLARLPRAGELAAVWVPDEGREAMRDPARAREAAVDDLRRKRQVVSPLPLRHGRVLPGKRTRGATHVRRLRGQSFTHPAQRVVPQAMVLAERRARERLARIEAAVAGLLPSWPPAPVVGALQAPRGIRIVAAATITVEAGDLSRFGSARRFMGCLGPVTGGRSTGSTVRRLGITGAGDGRLRRALVGSAWTCRHPPRTGAAKHCVLEGLPASAKDVAWKARTRLCARHRALAGRGKPLTAAATAVARGLAGFVWAIGREVKPVPTA